MARSLRAYVTALAALSTLCLGMGAAVQADPPPSAPAIAAGAKYLVELAPTDESPGLGSGLLKEARQALHDELEKRAEWAVDPAGVPTDAAGLKAFLAAHGLVGYGLHARLLNVTHTVLPPADGKKWKVLEVDVTVTLVGASIPDAKLAIGGDGDSTDDEEIAGDAPSAKELKQAEADTLADAISQAVDDMTQGLNNATPAQPMPN
jgi:hypothetical protein